MVFVLTANAIAISDGAEILATLDTLLEKFALLQKLTSVPAGVLWIMLPKDVCANMGSLVTNAKRPCAPLIAAFMVIVKTISAFATTAGLEINVIPYLVHQGAKSTACAGTALAFVTRVGMVLVAF